MSGARERLRRPRGFSTPLASGAPERPGHRAEASARVCLRLSGSASAPLRSRDPLPGPRDQPQPPARPTSPPPALALPHPVRGPAKGPPGLLNLQGPSLCPQPCPPCAGIPARAPGRRRLWAGGHEEPWATRPSGGRSCAQTAGSSSVTTIPATFILGNPKTHKNRKSNQLLLTPTQAGEGCGGPGKRGAAWVARRHPHPSTGAPRSPQ